MVNSSEKFDGQKGEMALSTTRNFGRRSTDSSPLQYVGSETLIRYEDSYGLFTPLTSIHVAEGEKDLVSETNSVKVIEMMRLHVTNLERDNLKLKNKLRKAVALTPRTPDDFVSAIQHSLDSLQSKLSRMENPVSEFVVKEFSIDTKVFIDVTPLGTIEYQFVKPGDEFDPQKLTNISLKLAPIPKQNGAGDRSSPDYTPFVGVEEIQGIGEVYKKKLNSHHIYTISDLLHAGTRIRSKVQLTALLEVDHRHLDEWINHADLMTVRGIDGRAAEVLYKSGTANLEQLAGQSADELTTRYNAEVDKQGHAVLRKIDPQTAAGWIAAAKSYVGGNKEQPSDSNE